MKNENHHQILHIRVSLGFRFQLKQTILIFETNLPHKRVQKKVNIKNFSFKNRKSEHHHLTRHI